uniref:Branched-chain-amino-acid aminotransferase n=1 Tax=Kalanchoe fedtschenkoi TaxID=63787 RepID=A0A7N0VMZ3_KALFE
MESAAVHPTTHLPCSSPNRLIAADSRRLLLPRFTDSRRRLLTSPTLKLKQFGGNAGLVSSVRCSARVSVAATPGVKDIDWDNIGFGLVNTDYMYVAKWTVNNPVFRGHLERFGNIEVNPAAGVLNYGQGLFEGLKAYNKHDGNILLFRPEENALRMQMGAERLCMPAPTVEQFVEAVKTTVLANKQWEGLSPINLLIATDVHRATPGGTGGIKTIGNYASVLKAQAAAKAKGYADVLYLDCVNKKYLEEVSSCNIFIVKDNIISTPAIKGTILPGITRKSVVDVARSQGFQVEERSVSVEELIDADEVFCTGTAVVISPVGSVTYQDKRYTYKDGKTGTITQQLYSDLTRLQTGTTEDRMNWTVEI